MPMKALAIVLLITMLASCSDESSTESSGPNDRVATPLTSDAATSYIQRCGGCHGAMGSDQAAQSLASATELTPSTIEAQIRAGGTQMPSFDNTLTDAEIDAIVRYIIDNL